MHRPVRVVRRRARAGARRARQGGPRRPRRRAGEIPLLWRAAPARARARAQRRIPKVLLLDEPCAGLSPSERQRFSQPDRRAAARDHADHDRARHRHRAGARRPRHRAASRQGHPRRHAGRGADQRARCGRCILAASEPLLAVRDIHTYYGDSYVLHGAEPGAARRARSSPSSAATAWARPR